MVVAEIHWTASRRDRQALERRQDWSGLTGVEQLWGPLAERYRQEIALDAPHAIPPERVSFQQLHERIEQLAAAFVSLGARPDEVVALFAENSPRWLQCDQGLMRAGVADAVRGSAAPIDELRYILQDSGAKGLVVESAALLIKLELGPEYLAPLRFVVVLEGEGGGELPGVPCYGWPELLQIGQDAQRAGQPAPQPSGDPSRLATILYTSGTTGQPKGVPLSHSNLLHQLQNLGVAVDPRPGDRVVSVLPIWHSYERSAEYFLFSCGCQQTYTSLKHLRADLQKVRPHYLISVPRLWEALLSGFEDALAKMAPARQRLIKGALKNSRAFALARRQALNLTLTRKPLINRGAAALEAGLRWPLHRLAEALVWPKVRTQLMGGRLRTALSGGGALPLHVDAFFEAIGIELLVGYGLTETSPVLTCRRRWLNRRGSAGYPLPETSLRIVDVESGRMLGIGERGLVLARGPQVMTGYWRRPDATIQVLDHGWFNTGDLGLLLPDGTLVLTGRAKDTIVLSSGENIEPGPLEEALAASVLIEQVMMVGQDRKQLGALIVPRVEALAAFAHESGLTFADGDDVDASLLRALTGACNRILAARPGSRPDERLAGVAMVEPFTLENGLLTQTLKQRRDRITDRDSSAIASIYD